MTRRRPRRWLGVVAVLWAVGLVVAAGYAARVGPPTVREQTTIVHALPTVDRAVGIVAAAAAGPQTVVSVGGYDRTQERCDAGNRTGQRYERSVRVFVVPGEEPAVVDRVADALPTAFRVSVRHAGDVHGLRADAGFYVRLSGGRTEPGALRFIADTGCRRLGGEIPPPAEAAPGPARTAVLGAVPDASGLRQYAVACPARGVLTTVTATGPARSLPTVAGAVLARPDLVAYLDGAVGVTMALREDALIVTGTAHCQ